MSGRNKKLSEKLKFYNVLLLGALMILIITLTTVLCVQLFGIGIYYKVESREKNIEKSKQLDTDEYETIGWIRVQGTNIDYPLYGVIKEGYDYPVTDSYLWSMNLDSDYHNVLITYGHNIMNLGPQPKLHNKTFTRMEQLMSFVYYDFAEDNEYIQLTMNNTDYLYKIFAANFMYVADLNEYPEGEFESEDKKNYVERLLKESIYDYDVDIKDSDNILSVVTCTRFFEDGNNYDFLVTGRLVRPGEKIKKYKVSRNKNYTKIDEKLKGDDQNEKDESV